MTNKGQQDEEEERGMSVPFFFLNYHSTFYIIYFLLFVEIIRVYDGNVTYRNGTPRSIFVSKQATYTQILVSFIFFCFYSDSNLFFLGCRTPHIPYK